MERGEGGKDVGVAGIEAVEDGEAHHGVPAGQSGCLAMGAGDEVEAVHGYVPRRSGGVNVVEGEPEEVDKEEHQREVEIDAILLLEVEPQAEKDGHGHPAEVEASGKEVEDGGCVHGPPFVGGDDGAGYLGGGGGEGDAEER